MRHATTPFRRLRRQKIHKKLPLHSASPFKGAGHGALLKKGKAL
jgi:hypothetical protein